MWWILAFPGQCFIFNIDAEQQMINDINASVYMLGEGGSR